MKKKYVIRLKKEEEKKIKQLLSSGTCNARVRNRAQILSLSNKGYSDKKICHILDLSRSCLTDVKRKYCKNGFETSVYDAPRAGRPPKFDVSDEAELTAIACSDPPEGQARWTLNLLKDNMKKPIGKSTIHLMLKKINANRGSRKCGVSAD